MSKQVFDPLRPTKAQEAEMVRGYCDATGGKTLCQSDSAPYRHGFRMGRNDKTGRADPLALKLIARMKAEGRI